ncbi:MAG: TrkH family potassium uptake protein, partial [Clostridia bacterium]|nr:TrkH family potassium uptake protein [Clostridia bacterium]
MNFKMIKYTLGWLMLFETAFLLIPLLTSLICRDGATISILLSMAITAAVAGLLLIGKPKNRKLYTKDGFVIVSLSWIFLSVFGAFPFVISGEIPNFVDALFETASGFSTTGASILSDVEALPKSLLMWRSFTQWVGGMGVLVFIMAFIPLSGARNLHIMKAESPGPEVSKLVPKMRTTAMILYTIYLVLTIIQFIFLLFGGMSLFDALNTAFATAGTGGFGFRNDSFASFSPYIQIVVTVFMLIFSINFNAYYLLFKGRIRDIFNKELRVFTYIVVIAITALTVNLLATGHMTNVGEAIRSAAFTLASLISTTGFSTADFNLWPTLSKCILVFIMFIGACAGSTGGGIKVSRIIILIKGMFKEFSHALNPRQVKKITIDSKPIDKEVVRSVNSYIVCYIFVFAVSLFLISFEGHDLVTSFTAIVATINN